MTTEERIEEALKDQEGLLRAMTIGVNRALMRHKRLGESIAGWDDDANVPMIVPSAEIPELPTEWPSDLFYGPRDMSKSKR